MSENDAPAIQILSTEIVYQNPYLTLREDKIRRLDGSHGIYSHIDKPDFALVIPEEADGFWLVEQFRYPAGKRSWEFPQGTFPAGESGTPEELAVKELSEETGISSRAINRLGYLHCAIGLTGQGFHIFHATGLTHGAPHRELEEQDMRHEWFARKKIEEMLVNGTITDDSTVAAYALLMLRG